MIDKYFLCEKGGTIARVSKQSWKHCKTIAIETGIQNVGVVRIYACLLNDKIKF